MQTPRHLGKNKRLRQLGQVHANCVRPKQIRKKETVLHETVLQQQQSVDWWIEAFQPWQVKCTGLLTGQPFPALEVGLGKRGSAHTKQSDSITAPMVYKASKLAMMSVIYIHDTQGHDKLNKNARH